MDDKLMNELHYLSDFVVAPHRGEMVPLADFTRERISKALSDAAKAIAALRRGESA